MWSRAVNPALYDHLIKLIDRAGYRFREVVQVGGPSARQLMLAVAAGRGVAVAVSSLQPGE